MAGEALITLRGNLGSDPELKITPKGFAVCNFSVAVTPSTQIDGEWKDGEPTWYRVTLWGRKAEIAVDALNKGTSVLISGTVQNRKYKDKEGNEKYSLEVNANDFGIVPKSNNAAPKATAEAEDEFPW